MRTSNPIDSNVMRPRGLLAVTIVMGILNLTAFASIKRSRFFVATLVVEIMVVLASYAVLRFLWRGKNWEKPRHGVCFESGLRFQVHRFPGGRGLAGCIKNFRHDDVGFERRQPVRLQAVQNDSAQIR